MPATVVVLKMLRWASLRRELVRILTLPCPEHRRLQSASLDVRLRWGDRLAMWGHWIACGPCRRFVGQLVRIDRAFRNDAAAVQEASLSEAARARIAAAITQAIATPPGDATKD